MIYKTNKVFTAFLYVWPTRYTFSFIIRGLTFVASTNAQGDPELSNVPEETKELDTNSGKPSSISNLDNKKEPKSPEFNSLKDIDGNVIKHDENEENVPEDPNQKVHFNLEATEEIQEVEIHPPQHPAKNPRKSILKRSDSIQKTLAHHDKKDNNVF